MLMRTPVDLGAAIRDHRRRQRLSQQNLAAKIGVSRQWVAAIEKGKGRAAIGLILRALEALGLAVSLAPDRPPENRRPDLADTDTMIDSIIENARDSPRTRLAR